MKVVSWKTLIVTLIMGGGIIYYAVREELYKEFPSLLWLCLCIYLIGKGLFVSFSKEAFENDQKQTALVKKIYREKFGIFAPVMPWMHIIIILLDALMIKVFPPTVLIKVTGIVLLLAAVVYVFVLSHWFRKAWRSAHEQEN